MKLKFHSLAMAAMLMLGAAPSVCAADAPVKREMRSAWVATVWQLDWPQNTVSSTGNTAQIDRQKKSMITLLDSMAVNNMNAVNFQVRSRCDAMYKSSFEPWSTDLVSERGLDPGWDPLQFVVEECHKRGLECHAWINPYRYESVANQWDGTPKSYRAEHPDWVMDVKGAAILNPGKPEVTQRICDVIKEIIDNYDVDGVLFDDYFYLSGTPDSADDDLYQAYTAAGGTLGRGDWRRDNVNRMIAAVYKTIKEAKPWVRFGVSPAGVACSSASVARKYGIPPSPGSDWQYNDIYSDPIAWVSQQSLDFISPQIYWTIGSSSDYSRLAPWWSMVAEKWGRHFFSSHSISSLTSSSRAPGMSGQESNASMADINPIEPLASGPNSESFEEYANEVRCNRESNLQDAPGSIFYSVKYMYRIAPLFANYLRNSVFNTPALVPAMTWLKAENPGNVENLSRSGSTLSWDARPNVRYTVYAVPSSIPMENFVKEPEYLLGTSYATSYTIPADRLTGYNYAVCVLDRYGNEYNPQFVGVATRTLDAPVLTSPVAGAHLEIPFDFTWQAVEGASSYIVDIATDADMSSTVCSREVFGSRFSAAEVASALPIGQTLYWRVRACGSNYNDGVSAVESFSVTRMVISSMADGDTEVSLTPEFRWSIPEREVDLQISTNSDFDDAGVIYTAHSAEGSHTVAPYVLTGYTTYYARLLHHNAGMDLQSPVVSFTTRVCDNVAPAIATPAEGATLYANQRIAVAPIQGPSLLRIEVCANDKFSGRSSYVSSNVSLTTFDDSRQASDIKIVNKGLQDGTAYYVRARAQWRTPDGVVNSDYSAPVKFVYSSTLGVADIDAPAGGLAVDPAGTGVIVTAQGQDVTLTAVAVNGIETPLFGGRVSGSVAVSLDALTPGVYVIKASGINAPAVKVAVK